MRLLAALTASLAFTALAACATPAKMLTPLNKPADMVLVGRIVGYDERAVDFISGGIDVSLIMGRTVIIEPLGKPGERVEFVSERACPPDKAEGQLYLVYLEWVQLPERVMPAVAACAPVDPATSFGIVGAD